MLAVPAGVRVWLTSGPTDMRRGMNGLALQVQLVLKQSRRRRFVVFRGKRGHLLKVLWADGLGLLPYIKRLERGRLIWPAPVGGVVREMPMVRLRSGVLRLEADSSDDLTQERLRSAP
jgi:transposase